MKDFVKEIVVIDEIKKRLLNDEREFDGFKDYDLKIENPNF